jgi:hypothetical protein
MSQKWWFTPVIPALGKIKQEDQEFEASLGPCLKKKKNQEAGHQWLTHVILADQEDRSQPRQIVHKAVSQKKTHHHKKKKKVCVWG